MVKGISRQVIVVHSPDKKLFEQAIFILNENAVGKEAVTDEMLLKEARQAFHSHTRDKRQRINRFGPVWAFAGALATGALWLISTVF